MAAFLYGAWMIAAQKPRPCIGTALGQLVWPVPQRCTGTCAPGSQPLTVDGIFRMVYTGPSKRLQRAVRRYNTAAGYSILTLTLTLTVPLP